MGLTVMLLVAAAVLLLGFALGTRFSELNMRQREKELARQRRTLTEEARQEDRARMSA